MRTLALLTALTITAAAQAGDGSVGIMLNRVVDDHSFGATFQYETELEAFPFEFDFQLQAGGAYRSKYHAEIKVPVWKTDVKFYTNGVVKGYHLADLGRQNDVGAAFEIPNTDIGIGIFGRNGSPYGSPNLLDEATALGYAEEVLAALGADKLNPELTALSIKDGNSLCALAYLDFEIGQVEGTLKVLPELTGDGIKAHQLLANFQTDWTLPEGLNLKLGVDVEVQDIDGEIEYETATLMSIGINFGADGE